MIKVEHIDVWGFEHAARAMRNPMNSWEKSDSDYGCGGKICGECAFKPYYCGRTEKFIIRDNDLGLMRRLYQSGTEHRTYARMIQVSMDVTAPLYFWKEMDRYSIGKSQVSCSTMHTLTNKPFSLEDFSCEHLVGEQSDSETPIGLLCYIIDMLNDCRCEYFEARDGKQPPQVVKEKWWQMIQLLPSSYNQRRTICMSYEVVFKIIKERTGHKLDEWNDFVKVLRSLPYIDGIIGEDAKDE